MFRSNLELYENKCSNWFTNSFSLLENDEDQLIRNRFSSERETTVNELKVKLQLVLNNVQKVQWASTFFFNLNLFFTRKVSFETLEQKIRVKTSCLKVTVFLKQVSQMKFTKFYESPNLKID